MAKMETETKVTPAVEEGLEALSLRRGGNLVSHHLATGSEFSVNREFPGLVGRANERGETTFGPEKLALTQTSPGTYNDHKTNEAGTAPGHYEYFTGNTGANIRIVHSRSLDPEPDADRHVPAKAPFGIVNNIRNGVVIGTFVGTPEKFGNN